MKTKSKLRLVEVAVRHPSIKVVDSSVKKLIHTLDTVKSYVCPTGDISIVFVNDAEIKKIHKDFMDDATVTDVITFVGEDHPIEPFAGEICVNLDQAKRVAKAHGYTFEEEVSLYVAHGWLHLTGLRDKKLAEAKKMRAAESFALAFIDHHKAWIKVSRSRGSK
jgi:probable rRNA maturation factor